MKQVRLFAAVAAALLFVLPASAQSAAPLTEREIAKFADDWPAVVRWFQSKGKALENASAANLVSAYLIGPDYASFVRSKGWTEDRFSYAAGTVFALLAYVQFEKQNPDMIKQFDDAIAQVRANPDIPAADKAETVRSLEDAKRAVLALPVEARLNEAELRLVRANYDRLMKAVEAGR